MSRIKGDKLEVFNAGVTFPVLEMGPFLVLIVISGWRMHYSLTVGECIMVTNNLVEGTIFTQWMILFKMERKAYNSDLLLLHDKWWRNFRTRNILVIESKVCRKISTLRAAHCM